MIRIAISTDTQGYPHNATLIASILRRTTVPVHVRCWCRGFLPESFETGALKVEFISATEEVTGRYPGHVSTAVFDRLRVIRDSTDWERCLILDHDMVCLSDLAEYFEEDFEGNLLMGRLFGPGNTVGVQMKARGALPASHAHATDYPFFHMGPMMNLALMREEGTWEKLLEAHAAIGEEEQISLTVATGGRTKNVAKKWNQVPQWDFREAPGDRSGNLTDPDTLEGIIHWTGRSKPWHRGTKVWRPDIWEGEKSSWEHLRMGIWRKPIAIEIEPEDEQGVAALAQRGWKVRLFRSFPETNGSAARPQMEPAFPDVETHQASADTLHAMLREDLAIDRVRIGRWVDPSQWLDGAANPPDHLVLQGTLDPEELDRVRALGYTQEARLMTHEWPAGGPLSRVLDFRPSSPGTGLGPGEEIHLKRNGRSAAQAPSVRIIGKPPVDEMKKIGVCVVVPQNCLPFADPLIRSIRWNFLSGHEVTVFLITDGSYPSAPDLRVIQLPETDSPITPMRRYGILRGHKEAFASVDFLYCMDVDLRVVSRVGEEILGDLVAVVHPGLHDAPRRKFTYEKRRESAACVADREGSIFFTGGFQGGRTGVFLEAIRVVAERVERDRAREVSAVWEDESHWNRYLIDAPPTCVLPPVYCGNCGRFDSDHAPKISAMAKNVTILKRLAPATRSQRRVQAGCDAV